MRHRPVAKQSFGDLERSDESKPMILPLSIDRPWQRPISAPGTSCQATIAPSLRDISQQALVSCGREARRIAKGWKGCRISKECRAKQHSKRLVEKRRR